MGSVVLIVIVSAAVLLLAVITWALNSRVAGERGWVYNRYNPRPRGIGTLGLLESIYQPSIEHVIEERASEKARGNRDDSGEEPEPGGGGREGRPGL